MSNRIYGALTDEFILRMRNWTRANAGEGVYASTSAFNLMRGGSYGGGVPVLIGEAEDTGACLSRLPVRYRQAVALFWQYEGARSLAWFARRCGVGVDYRTYERRVMDGHELLKSEFARHYERIARFRAQFARSDA